MERCHYDECQQNILVSYTCTECLHIFCETHKKSESHDCLNPKHNYKNKNNKTESPSIEEIKKDIESLEFSDNDNETINCQFKNCTQTSDIAIFIKCDTCNRTYCTSHVNMDVHNCKNIKLTLKEIAIINKYWQCKKCTFINAPTSKKCMVCQLLSANDTSEDIDNIEHICPYCTKCITSVLYEIHLTMCENEFVNRKRTTDSVLDEIICPHCKRAVYQCTFDYHIQKCSEKHCINNNNKINEIDGINANTQLNNSKKSDKTDIDMSLSCDKCDMYISYKVYDFHILWCKGKIKEKDRKCPVCKKSVPMNTYVQHLQICYDAIENTQSERNKSDTGQFCPVCKELFPNEIYTTHLGRCYREKDGKDATKKKCPFCKQCITKDYLSHIQMCNIDGDEIENDERETKKSRPMPLGLTSERMRPINDKAKRNVRGKYVRRRSGNKEKHLWKEKQWKQTRLSGHVKITEKAKRKFESQLDNDVNDEPKLKKMKYYKKDLHSKEPYHKETVLYLQQLKENEMEMDNDGVKCYWKMTKQFCHSDVMYTIGEDEYKMLKNGYKDLNGNMMEFMLKYIYSGWLNQFKNRIYIFNCEFYERQLKQMDENSISYYNFLFEKDFIVIPKWNDMINCWEIIIICYSKYVKNKKGIEKPCIVVWDVLQKNNKGKNKMNKNIRKWLNLQYKHKYDSDNNKNDAMFTSNTMRAYNTVKIGKLMDETHLNQSGYYQLLNFKKWGINAGYAITATSARLNPISFGFEEIEEYKQEIVAIVDTLHKKQQQYL